MWDMLGASRTAKKKLTLFLPIIFAIHAECSTFQCDGGSTVLDQSKVNDNFCDCMVDGADETLTPACSHLSRFRFTCLDSGPLNQTILMSRVWDGVCDCCDGSDEVYSGGGGASNAASCDPLGCEAVIRQARADAVEARERIKTGLSRRSEAEAEGRKAVERWETSLRDDDAGDELRSRDRDSVEKLQAQLKVYLQEEERLERRERASLARSLACRSDEGWNRAAALGPCTDDTEEQEAAARVRAARAAARARREAEEEKESKGHGKNGSSGGGKKASESEGSKKRSKSRDKAKNQRKGGGGGDPATVKDILDLTITIDAGGTVSTGSGRGGEIRPMRSGGDDSSEGGTDGGSSATSPEPQEGERMGTEREVVTLSLRSYVKQRQEGSSGKGMPKTDEKKAKELRQTALLGPVLNAGERGVHLGLTLLLRAIGLPLFGPVRAVLAACWFFGEKVTEAAADAAVSFGLPKAIVNLLEGYRDHGLPGLNRRLDYRRFPLLRSIVVRCQDFFAGPGKFLVVIWDAPVALWEFFFPERLYDHQRPEAAMLREGIELARNSLEARDRARPHKGRGRKMEAEKMLSLDLGEERLFAALAEICLELNEGGYTYSLCPFKEAKQGKYSLGRWKDWGEDQGRDGHPSMLFDGGSRFHDHRKRSAEVLVECGPDHALVAATELEVGNYLLTMETPLACTDDVLLETQRGLEIFEVLSAPGVMEAMEGASDVPRRQEQDRGSSAAEGHGSQLEEADDDLITQAVAVPDDGDELSEEKEEVDSTGDVEGDETEISSRTDVHESPDHEGGDAAKIDSPDDLDESLGDDVNAENEGENEDGVPTSGQPGERREYRIDTPEVEDSLGDDSVEQLEIGVITEDEGAVPEGLDRVIGSEPDVTGSEALDEGYQGGDRDQVGNPGSTRLDEDENIDIQAVDHVGGEEVDMARVTHKEDAVPNVDTLEGYRPDSGVNELEVSTDKNAQEQEMDTRHVLAAEIKSRKGHDVKLDPVGAHLEASSGSDVKQRGVDANATAQVEVSDGNVLSERDDRSRPAVVEAPHCSDVSTQLKDGERSEPSALDCKSDGDEESKTLVAAQANEDEDVVDTKAVTQVDAAGTEGGLSGEDQVEGARERDASASVEVSGSSSNLDDERKEASSVEGELRESDSFDERGEEL